MPWTNLLRSPPPWALRSSLSAAGLLCGHEPVLATARNQSGTVRDEVGGQAATAARCRGSNKAGCCGCQCGVAQAASSGHFPSPTSLRPLHFQPTSRRPLPFQPTSLPAHFPSPTSLRPPPIAHFPSRPLPFAHLPSRPLPFAQQRTSACVDPAPYAPASSRHERAARSLIPTMPSLPDLAQQLLTVEKVAGGRRPMGGAETEAEALPEAQAHNACSGCARN